ncbi:hypothetical protein [Corynebacterium freiburgense]|uniref:hypothetical protein n=1 Tax=Corynebacterium freiburgense TaxID=556548 RepID=UPI00041ECEE1|nr:hypothetical protein [Corynebacterium freiburgense]WJZ02105.1 hypothetical protein CFREI_04035 [Corynebacterium freiburgense]
MKKLSPAVGLCAALFVSVSVMVAPLAIAEPGAATETSGVTTLENVKDLKTTPGLSGTVVTEDHVEPNDNAGMTFTVENRKPEGTEGDIAVPLVDGKWAVPKDIPNSPTNPVDKAAADSAITRAQTFIDAGTDLKWNAQKPSPVTTNEIVHQKSSKPYGVTCSSFVGMVLKGWDYQHTTYVSDTNKTVGPWVDFGDNGAATDPNMDLWQAHKLARWFHTHGDLWVADGNQGLEPGDIIFLSEQKPEGKDANTGTYFGNVYHAALYVGNNKVIHSYGESSGAGVVEQEYSDHLRDKTSFIARPSWSRAQDADAPGTDPEPQFEHDIQKGQLSH